MLVLLDDQTFGHTRAIVGVVTDTRARAVAEPAQPLILLPHAQYPNVFRPTVAVRSSLPPHVIAAAVRERLRRFDPQLLVQRTVTMNEVVSGALSRPRFNLLLVGGFAGIALGLAAIGVYGVVALLVNQRTREIGVRVALGARSADILRTVFMEGLSPVAFGAVAGVLGAVAAATAIRSLLFDVSRLDPVSFALAPIALAAVAVTAAYLPARRALLIDPMSALREE
jgi:predicted lysophospholipase L1 biosynthesis ABC-type transport system permease subunit